MATKKEKAKKILKGLALAGSVGGGSLLGLFGTGFNRAIRELGQPGMEKIRERMAQEIAEEMAREGVRLSAFKRRFHLGGATPFAALGLGGLAAYLAARGKKGKKRWISAALAGGVPLTLGTIGAIARLSPSWSRAYKDLKKLIFKYLWEAD